MLAQLHVKNMIYLEFFIPWTFIKRYALLRGHYKSSASVLDQHVTPYQGKSTLGILLLRNLDYHSVLDS